MPPSRGAPVLVRDDSQAHPSAASWLSPVRGHTDDDEVLSWLAEVASRRYVQVERAPLDELDGWEREPATGDVRHGTGRFFAVRGLEVRDPDGRVPRWDQPIIDQPEVGILGILVKEFDGVPHFLMQAKGEPGNANGLQLSPTVQATRSNYTRVHHGESVPYMDYFLDPAGYRRIVADTRQSEQGAWFLGKRNRNMLVHATEDVPERDGFRWLPLRQLHRLLHHDDMINMDARTVLASLPLSGRTLRGLPPDDGDGFRAALRHSCSPDAALHTTGDLLSWITVARCSSRLTRRPIPLDAAAGWRRVDGRISHDSGGFFDIIGVRVNAVGREVGRWSQPMLEPHGTGVIGFLVRSIDGVLHALVQMRREPGYVDLTELGPTVQCTPDSYRYLPESARPRYLDEMLGAAPDRIRFDTVLSEEGGRFFHARSRYLIVETDEDVATAERDDQFRWMTLSQLTELLRHSHYVNVQARSLVACLRSLLTHPN